MSPHNRCLGGTTKAQSDVSYIKCEADGKWSHDPPNCLSEYLRTAHSCLLRDVEWQTRAAPVVKLSAGFRRTLDPPPGRPRANAGPAFPGPSTAHTHILVSNAPVG